MISTAEISAFRPYLKPVNFVPNQEQLRQLVALYEPTSSTTEMLPETTETPKERNRRKRTTFTSQQATLLEAEYVMDRYMAREKRQFLAESLGLTESQVKTWFQNRRAKDKREKRSVDSPSSSTSGSTNEQRIAVEQRTAVPNATKPIVNDETNADIKENKEVNMNDAPTPPCIQHEEDTEANSESPTNSDVLQPQEKELSSSVHNKNEEEALRLPPISLQPFPLGNLYYSEYLASAGLNPLSSITTPTPFPSMYDYSAEYKDLSNFYASFNNVKQSDSV